MWWLLGSISYLAILAFVTSRFTPAASEADAALLLTQLIGVVAGVFAAFAAFASVIPGYSRQTLTWPGITTVLWLLVLAFFAFRNGEWQLIAGAQHEWVCVAIILIGGAPLAVALAAMLREGAPLNPALTALYSAIAVGLLTNFAACVSFSHNDYAITLAWHGSAVAFLTLLYISGAHRILTWHSR